MTAPWLKKVLRELEGALVLLVDVEAGRAPCGGETFEEQRTLARKAALEKIANARRDYERQSATLNKNTRRRAATFFGAAHMLQLRVLGFGWSGSPDSDLAAELHRFEEVAN